MMKRLFILLAICLALCGQAFAQRCLPGMKGFEFTVGAADRFTIKNKDGQAFHLGLALSTYSRNGNQWKYGIEYFQKQYEYKDIFIPVSQFTGEGGYYLNFLSDRSKTFYFSTGISVLAGYETINWGKKTLKDGASLAGKDKFLYGAAISLQIESYITDRIVLFLNARERFLPSSSVTDFHFLYGFGLKVIIN